MIIALITPAAAQARNGNRNTALRWAALLRELGHTVRIDTVWDGRAADVMMALHARRSRASIEAFAHACPGRPLIVVLTGTDLYRDIAIDPGAQHALRLASRLVVLQPLGTRMLPADLQARATTIVQSAVASGPARPLRSCFELLVSGHLREEKDPFRAAAASRLLPSSSRVRITHLGRALTADMAAEAREWMTRAPRYRWLGERPHARALQVLRRSRAMIISSRMEGGANVVCEALACGTPVIASLIDGNIGLLGEDYPGYFPVGDEGALAELIGRFEHSPAFRSLLADACRQRQNLVDPQRERKSLADLLLSTFTRAQAAPAAA